jgi:hypothetical protein
MPNVDDHGLEVLKKAARNLDVVPKKDYAIQTILVKDESGEVIYSPSIINFPIAVADVEEEIELPVGYKYFILKARKVCRLRLSFEIGGTTTEWVTIPRGGYWVEERRFASNKVYVQSSIDNNVIEVVVYS